MNWPTTNQRGPRRPREKAWTPPKGISPGDPEWMEPEQVQAWFDEPREYLQCRSWRDVFKPWGQPMGHQNQIRFAAMVKAGDELMP